MQAVDIVPRQSQMQQVTSRQGSCQMRLGLEKPQADRHTVSLLPTAVPDSSPIATAKAFQPVRFYPTYSVPT
jgi:hypothetical protein